MTTALVPQQRISKMSLTRKTVSEQLVEFIKENEAEVNEAEYSVVEFVIQNGKLHGMRTRRYTKNIKN